MQNTYELIIAYKPILFDDLKKGAISKIDAIIKELDGSWEQVENHGKKLLAYEIKGMKEGHYVEYKLNMDSMKSDILVKELNLNQDVLRFLVIKK